MPDAARKYLVLIAFRIPYFPVPGHTTHQDNMGRVVDSIPLVELIAHLFKAWQRGDQGPILERRVRRRRRTWVTHMAGMLRLDFNETKDKDEGRHDCSQAIIEWPFP